MPLFIELAHGLPWLYLSLVFLFSLMIGSFLNVVIHRLPIMLERECRRNIAATSLPMRRPRQQGVTT